MSNAIFPNADAQTKIVHDLEKTMNHLYLKNVLNKDVPNHMRGNLHDELFNTNQKNVRLQQARALKKRRIFLEDYNAQVAKNQTPRLNQEDNEEVFKKVHQHKAKGILPSKAKTLLQLLRQNELENDSNIYSSDDEEDEKNPHKISSIDHKNGSIKKNNKDNLLYKVKRGNQGINKKANKGTAEEIEETLKKVLGENDDEVNRYLILNAALDQAGDDPALKERIHHFFDQHYKKNGKKITAMVNVLDEANNYGNGEKSKVVLFQNAYYTMLEKVKKPEDMLDVLLNSFDMDEFETVSNLMSKAAVTHQQAVIMPCLHKETMHTLLAFMKNRTIIKSMIETIDRSIMAVGRLIKPLEFYKKNHPRTPFGEFDDTKNHLIPKKKHMQLDDLKKEDDQIKSVY